MGLPHSAKVLARSRALLQSAKRRARMPLRGILFHASARNRPLFERVPKSPRKLFKPAIEEVNPKDVYKHVPELEGLPLDAIRRAMASGIIRCAHQSTRHFIVITNDVHF